jgi:hypothetical protein
MMPAVSMMPADCMMPALCMMPADYLNYFRKEN